MRAIQTRFQGATDSRGARVVAEWCDDDPDSTRRRVSLARDYGLDPEQNARAAAAALADGFHGDPSRWQEARTRAGWLYLVPERLRVRHTAGHVADPEQLGHVADLDEPTRAALLEQYNEEPTRISDRWDPPGADPLGDQALNLDALDRVRRRMGV